MFLQIICIVLCLLIWSYTRWTAVKEYWEIKGVPYWTPNIIFGSLTFLQRQNPGLWMRKIYDTFNAPYVGIWLFWRPALVINSPEIARRVLVKDFANFRDRYLSSGKSDPIGGLNLFTVNDPLWSSLRRRLTPAFSAAKLKLSHGIISAKKTELVLRIKREMETKNFINLRMLLSDYTTDVIGASAFGISCDSTLTGEGPLRTITKEFQTFNLIRGINWCCIFFIPQLVDIFRFSFFPKHTTDYFRKIFRTIVAQRSEYNEEQNNNKDLFDALLKIKQDYKSDDKELSEDTLIAQAAIFLLAGFDTTATALSFCVYELAFLPDLQEKLYEEILEATKNKIDTELDAKLLTELVLLNSAMKETLRKYPAMGWLDRVAVKDYQIDKNLTIKAGTPIYVNGIGMHYDPKLFPEPEKFNIDRFFPENEKKIIPFSYMPFGEGPRQCIGRRFGEQNFRSTLATIMLTFKIKPKSDSPPPSQIEIDKNGLFFYPGQELLLEFIPRDNKLIE